MKSKTIFVCTECGYESVKWLGKCPDCGSWSSLVEETTIVGKAKSVQRGIGSSSKAVPMNEVTSTNDERISTKLAELDRVLGGGIVRGSLVLVGGDPGIGKSTLLLQICQEIGKESKILYVSGEESANQIKIRANRLKVDTDSLLLMSETSIDIIVSNILSIKPSLVIIDSIQTMFSPNISSAPGSVSQVREATMALMRVSKENNISIFIVGHVTKDGNLAGPRVLEHMVDCVLYFEGERHQSYRILRAVKNRFGSTNEIGVFEMADVGLVEVLNPSLMLLKGRPENTEGSAVVCTMEGTRPVLAEIQALVAPSGFGIPRRMATGIDYNRVILLIAVLEKRVGLNMQNQDAYVNVVGGLKIDETATDLAVILSIASSFKNFLIDPKTIIIGEVGLTGEIRAVNHAEKRAMEANKLGFSKCIMPFENSLKLKKMKDFSVYGVKTVKEALVVINKINKESV